MNEPAADLGGGEGRSEPGTEPSEAFGIDDPLTLDGRQTTLREEHQRGKVALVRGNLRASASRRTFAYWAIVRIDRDAAAQFRISKDDFKLLAGSPSGRRRVHA